MAICQSSSPGIWCREIGRQKETDGSVEGQKQRGTGRGLRTSRTKNRGEQTPRGGRERVRAVPGLSFRLGSPTEKGDLCPSARCLLLVLSLRHAGGMAVGASLEQARDSLLGTQDSSGLLKCALVTVNPLPWKWGTWPLE